MIDKALKLRMIEWFVKYEATVRRAAGRFGISKSTVHTTLQKAAKQGNTEVDRILKTNWNEKAKRGGQSKQRNY